MKIEIKDYTKVIKGKTILDNVNYTFEGGRIYGLQGRNGSGKTMLLRAISGLMFATSGHITIDGKVLHKDIEFPENLGLIIESTELLPQFDAFTNLKLIADIKKVATDEDIRRVIEDVGLDEAGKKKVKEYSLGMRQKLAIAQAIFEKPEILLLDEPTNGLDEASVEKIRKLLKVLAESGTLIIVASHSKEDIEFLSDELIKIDNGRIV